VTAATPGADLLKIPRTALATTDIHRAAPEFINHPYLATLRLLSSRDPHVVTYGAADDIRIARAALSFPIGRNGLGNYHTGRVAAPLISRHGKGAARLVRREWSGCRSILKQGKRSKAW
jgi:hypothetical protein